MKSSEQPFSRRVRAVVAAIPRGTVMTYAAVAKAAGAPRAHRAVGTIMAGNRDTLVPCHRVVRSDGTIGTYNGGGPDKKREKLISEGVLVKTVRGIHYIAT
ncbi:MAG: MGMT family protein [Candidatus Kaiserbacteria bacterium]|nr:MGMT family protein [Candidatus Kaiserbacteria bacterium]